MKPHHFLILILLALGPVLLGQSVDNKNSYELSVFATDKKITGFHRYSFKSVGLMAKYKRRIYESNVNSLSVGISYQSLKPSFMRIIDIYDGLLYRIESEQSFKSLGLSFTNRSTIKRKKLGFFLDLELSALYNFSFKQNTMIELGKPDLTHQSFAPAYIATGDFVEADDDFNINRVTCYFNIQPGIEFYLKNKKELYFGLGLGKNINSLFKESLIYDLLPAVEHFHYVNMSLSAGIRF